MDPWEVLEAQVAVVATLGKLVATMTVPHRHAWPIPDPESLHTALRKFTWTFRDTLHYHGIVTSLGQRAVTSLGQALATLKTTPGATQAYPRRTVRAWQESVNALQQSWDRAFREVRNLLNASAGGSITNMIKQLFIQWENTHKVVSLPFRLVPTSRYLLPIELVLLVVVTRNERTDETRMRQWAVEVWRLLMCLGNTCSIARDLTCEVQDVIRRIELIVEMREEASPDVLQDLMASLAKVKRLSEASARLATDHLLGTVEDIHDLFLSLCGGSGGSGGLSVAEQCQEAIEDTPRPFQKQHMALLCGKTNNGSSITGMPEQPEGAWGKLKPGAVCEIASHLPRDPDLLPPGSQCELVTSNLIHFLKDCCHQWIPIGVTGTSQQRQDFLIIGKDSNRTLGLSVIPAVVSVNCKEELRVLAFAYKAPLVILPKTPIAIAIALPMNRNERAGNAHWIKYITNEEPEEECSLTHRDKTIRITGTLDTGSDLTVISYEFWPKDWNLVAPEYGLTGIGGATVCMQSESMITVTGPKGKTATTRPYVVKEPIVLWGRDVLSQWRAKMEVDS